MLFLHGYLSRKESFYYQIKFFSKQFRVTAPDILGFGASSPLDEAYSVADYVCWLKDFAKAAKIEKPHIIAHSFGARVALRCLGEYPDFAEKLVITGGAGIVKPRSPQYMRRVNAYRRVKRLFPKFAEKHFGSAEYRTLSPLMRESYKKIVNEDLRRFAEKIQNETLLIYGESDSVTPPDEEGATFNGLIKGSRLELINGGHFCFSENPLEFNECVYGFLTDSRDKG